MKKNKLVGYLKVNTQFLVSLGSRFALGIIFIVSCKELIPSIDGMFKNASKGFEVGMTVVSFAMVIVVLFLSVVSTITKFDNKGLISKIGQFILIPVTVWYSDMIGVLMYFSGIWFGALLHQAEWYKFVMMCLFIISSVFLTNYTQQVKLINVPK